MTDRRWGPDEQAFLAETGLRPDDLEALVADAPPLPAEARDRIRRRAREKAGTAPAPALGDASGPPGSGSAAAPDLSASGVAKPRPRPRRWIAAAAAVLLLAGGAVALSNPDSALAAIQRLVRLVPGIGLTETDAETWILPEPVSVEREDVRVTVTGLMSSPDEVHLQFRVDWPPLPHDVKARFSGGTASPQLRLPDGTLIRARDGFKSGGSRHMLGEHWFAPLPPGTRDLVVVFPYLSGLSDPVEVPVSLVNAAEAGLAEAHPGSWSEEQRGVQVGVPYWAAAGDRIVVSLDALAPEGVTVKSFRDWIGDGKFAKPGLTDDQGLTYPLLDDECDLSGTQARAVFRGPLAPDARRLTLTVPSLILVDHTAEARLTLPLDQLPEGKPLRLGEALRIGGHRFTVRTVTRVDPDTFEFTFDLGPEEDGVLLQDLNIRDATKLFARVPLSQTSYSVNEQIATMKVEFAEPPAGRLEVVFTGPTFRLRAGWEVELQVPAGRSETR